MCPFLLVADVKILSHSLHGKLRGATNADDDEADVETADGGTATVVVGDVKEVVVGPME